MSSKPVPSMLNLDDLSQSYKNDSYGIKNFGPEESLLNKYKIPIQHFDFKYVSRAKNPNELEKIMEVLISGQEGYYPDLLRATEDKLRRLKPNSRFLRRTSKVLNKKELAENEVELISDDMQKWVSDVSRDSKELEQKTTKNIRCEVQIRRHDSQPEQLKLVKDEKRISSTDYRAWDQYDPDTELLKQELGEERMKQQAKQAQKAAEKMKLDAGNFVYAETSRQSHVTTNDLNNTNIKKLKTSVPLNQYYTEVEASFTSNRELEKGREFFTTGDYEFALKCFTQSILCKPSVINLSNRALTFLKLNKFEEAVSDCDHVLAIDDKDLNALLRKAQALEGLKKYEEALDCVDLVIEKDPNNNVAQELAERVRKYCRNLMKNTRMKIIEIQ
ncbi:sperm-associated antigen 1 [Euwallacea fornicatus]|uniref:sperm-associated antigen 1 n=1 Tax=Euwallacea fornicatus TaxID=995702 RepID=UPI00338DC070